MSKQRVLIVDDSVEMAQTVADYLRPRGLAATPVGSGGEAVERLRAEPIDAVLTDLRMRGMDGLDVLDAVRAFDNSIPVIIMTAFGAVESAVEAIQRGAYHYVTKPFKLEVVALLLERAVKERRLQSENEGLRQTVRDALPHPTLVGRSEPIRDLARLISRVAGATTTVLLTGETGTGKELVARAIHDEGPRRDAAFVAVNCAALPEPLLESELFGHARGAFTGASQPRRGLFVEADGGTLLLDEIGDMPLPLQGKLLRVLQSGEVRPVGSDAVRSTDVRVVAATHRDLSQLVREGRFREDLFFRIRVVPIRVPPLRERREDVPLLAEHFLERSRGRFPAAVVRTFSPAAMQLLLGHDWPGNVRELENLVERCVVTGTEEVVAPGEVRGALDEDAGRHPLVAAQAGLWTLQTLEQRYIQWVMERVDGNKTRAAEILGIDPSTLYRREKRGATD